MRPQNKILPNTQPSVLAIGGIDPSGGAGLFIDNLAISAAGCHFCGICTTMTIQNGQQFFGSTPQSASDIAQTIHVLHQSQQIRCLKTGALGSASIIAQLVEFHQTYSHLPLVIDPVLLSTTGGALMDSKAQIELEQKLLPRASLITPNLHEAAFLCKMEVNNVDDMQLAALKIRDQGAHQVLIKGGHLPGNENQVVDVFVDANGTLHQFASPRLDVGEIRGTGCALASSIAAHIALGETIKNGVERARTTLSMAMKHATSLGQGPKILNFYH